MSSRAALRKLMAQAASAGSLETVYQAALHCVQLGLDVERASLLLFDASRTVRFVAWSGLSDEYRRAVDGHSPWSPDEANATPLLVSDVEHDAAVASYIHIFRKEGIRALAFIPVQSGASLLGKFMLYYQEPHEFSDDEIATAEQIADYVVFALEHHRISVALEAQLISERDLRQQAEAESDRRHESESRLNLALTVGQMGAWDWDLRTGRVHWSEALERIHGLAPGTFGGSLDDVLRLIHPLDAETVADSVTGAIAAARDYQMDYRIVRPDGIFRWLTCKGRPLVDSEGAPVRMVGVCSDVTDIKRMQEAAREADQRKDDFLATLAHELRNPLAPLRTGIAVLQRANGDPDTILEHCATMERQLRHLTRLVDDLLDVAELTRRGLPLYKTRIELSTVVSAALEQERAQVEHAGHQLSVSLPAEPIILNADPVRLVQILTNLLGNAVKYTPRGGRIALAIERDGDAVRISVRDSGLGIPPEKLSAIFEMFGQLDRSLETGYRGLGIGLALSNALVAMHGGRITAASEGLLKGSEFTVWLPVPIAVDSAPRPAIVGQAGDASVPAICRILLAEDNRDVAMSMFRFLRQLGHDVRVAYDGTEAVQVAESFRPDVVLMDIGMPRLNGFDAARTLRSQPWGREMTLVALTGWGREHDQRMSFAAGFDQHLTKPVEPLALEALLNARARTVGALVGQPETRARAL